MISSLVMPPALPPVGGVMGGVPVVVAATATPYKFPETCLKAFGEDYLIERTEKVAEILGITIYKG